MRFNDCLAIILKFEGKPSDIPGDRGGPTALGITQGTYDTYRMAIHLPLQPVRSIGNDEARGIYKRQYFDAVRAATLPEPLDLVMFDSAVQHGPRQAIKFLQHALGIPADGVLGPMTAKALNEEAVAEALHEVWTDVIDQRRVFYNELATRVGQAKFLKGWLNRIDKLKILCES